MAVPVLYDLYPGRKKQRSIEFWLMQVAHEGSEREEEKGNPISVKIDFENQSFGKGEKIASSLQWIFGPAKVVL